MTGGLAGLSGQRALIIGGTGFLGSRLVERLVVEAGVTARVLVRDFSTAARIARFPIEMQRGDVLDPAAVEQAARDCDVIVHCAYGNSGDYAHQRRVNVEGTRHVLEAARRTGTRRVVCISTLSVYGALADGDLTEASPRRKSGSAYGDSKLEAEELALGYHHRHRVPVSVLQPTIIYGPYGPLWTVEVLERLRTTGVLMINGGEGLCNLVYVDDVVSAIAAALVREEAIGETFLISADQPVTWRQYYASYERMLGLSGRTLDLTAAEARAYHRRRRAEQRLGPVLRRAVREDPVLRERIIMTPEAGGVLRLVRRVVPGGVWKGLKGRLGAEPERTGPSLATVAAPALSPPALHPRDIQLHAARAHVRIDKAMAQLGYRPAFDLAAGMDVTGEWAGWANLLGGPAGPGA